MVTSRQADVSIDAAASVQDLGPLAWVLEETRKSIEAANKSLKRFAREAQAAQGVDIASADLAQLRLARQQLHQAVGALEMVSQPVVAQMVRGMETAVQQWVLHPEHCNEAATVTLERAGFALMEYLESQLGANPRPALGLFPQFRQVQEMAGAERIHPADLWDGVWQWVDPAAPPSSQALSYGPDVRQRIDQLVLKVMRSADAHAAAELSAISLGLAAGEQRASHAAIFWQLCGGFFQALGLKLEPIDIYARRAASSVLLQYATLARGERAVAERLALDLLFFCAQARPSTDAAAPALAAVRQAWGLSRHEPVDYQQPVFGLYDPAVLAQARRRIDGVKENWSALSGGDMARLRACVNQFGLVGESLDKLYDKGKVLSEALNRVVTQVAQTSRPPSPELAMETATAVLFLEASFTDFQPGDAQFVSRMQQLAERLDSVRSGGAAAALEPWMEELYRKFSDRQTMGTVVSELRTSLGEVEQHLDQFFRHPADKSVLATVPTQMSQMRGVLSVLGLDQAALAVGQLSDAIDRFFAAEAAPGQVHEDPALFERIGNSLGALGFQIDMLGYQPKLARKLFVYDTESGELRYVSGRAESAKTGTAADRGAAGAPPARATAAAREQSVDRLPQPAAQQSVAPQPQADAGAIDDTDDDLLDIFLEEAREVVQTGRQALQALQAEPGDLEQQTTLRRAFHTLKGSSRMVGLAEFGEAAWSMEQLLNAWLAEQKPLSSQVHGLSGEAIDAFARWIDDIAGKRAAAWRAAPFREAADALRLRGKRMSLASLLGGAAPAADARPPDDAAKAADARPVSVTADDGLKPDGAEAIELPALATAAPPLLANFDLPDLELPGPTAEPASTPAPAAADVGLHPLDGAAAPMAELASPAAAEAQIASLQLDLSLPDDAQIKTNAVPEEPPAVARADEIGEPSDSLLAEFEASQLTETQPAPAADTAAAPDSDQHDAAEPPPEDDEDENNYKHIGDLRISAALHNVYLNEADDWSRQLAGELSEWALEPDRPVPDLAIARAHSLAGSSATVGFKDLSVMARAIEHALERLVGQRRATAAQLQTLGEAAEDIRRVLHQFAAGILKAPSPAILAAVQAIEPAESADDQPAPSDDGRAEASRQTDDALAQAASVAPPAVAAPVVPATLPLPTVRVIPTVRAIKARPTVKPAPATKPAPAVPNAPAAPVAPAAEALHVAQVAGERVAGGPVAPAAAALHAPTAAGATQRHSLGEGIDAVDAVDPDLFPIFEEEAQELLPRLSAALRQWAAHTGDQAARGEALRTLHTLKGSARLAGALRLGDMAHRVESAAQVIGTENVRTQDVEPLLDHLDELLDDFRRLQTGGVASVGAERAPESPEQLTAAEAEAPVIQAQLADSLVSAEPAAAPAPETPAPVARGPVAPPAALSLVTARAAASQAVRVRAQLLDRMLDQAGEMMTSRARLEVEAGRLRNSLNELTGNLGRLRQQLRDVELQAETQMQSRLAQSRDAQQNFDPLEFDRFTRMQELTRIMAESVNDIATVQHSLQRALEASEDDLVAQARQSRELQRDLLRTRMVEFESISERLYRVVRQTAKETDKQVRLDIVGGAIEVDRGILERMTGAFEHLLRNSVVHGIEAPAERTALGKDPVGTITVEVHQSGNDVSIEFRDDGAGLNLARIRERALQKGIIKPDQQVSEAELDNLVFMPGFTTATVVTELAGRGVGMDVVRTEVQAIGGRIETQTAAGKGTAFRLLLPLTTAVTHVVMVRADHLAVGVPSNLVEIVRRVPAQELQAAYQSGHYRFNDEDLPFYWAGALLQTSARSSEPPARTSPVAIFRSANRRVAVHVDQVLGNQEVVVKPLGPQLARLPGLVAMTALASGAVALIYNPVALATVYGEQARALSVAALAPPAAPQQAPAGAPAAPVAVAAPHSDIPLVLVVDDSITVRRVTQRLLQREGYRVALAADGLQGLEQLQIERPAVVLSDIEMPRMDGFDFVRNIRADEKLRDLPVIMITSRIAAKHRDHATELGVDHYLGKPYSEDELLGLIKGYVRASAVQ